MSEKLGTWREWWPPAAFVVCAGWTVWHLPAWILDFVPHKNESRYSQISALYQRKDATPDLGGPIGGFTDWIDWVAMLLLPVLFYFGVRSIRVAHMEFQDWRPIDRPSLFVGRVTMILILSMTLVMLYEVFLRYAIEAPTLWANELTLWIAGFVFLCSGLYAMQQRCHIRIFILYDMVPRWLQRTFDTIWTVLLVIFCIGLIFGSYKQVFVTKFHAWEMFGTAFDPPIPATIQPTILILITLIALQAVINLISDWNLKPTVHTAADDVDEEEIEAIKRTLEKT